LRGQQPQRRRHGLAVLAALAVVALWLMPLTHPSEAATRGLALEIKASEAPNAPTVETVNLYTHSYALVIGINDYDRGWQRLSKAVSDARRVAKALEKHGFDVTLRTDLKSDDLAATLKNFFIDRGRDPDARLFVWFAGHGATVDGEGYLIPSDGAAPTDETGFLRKALSLRDFGKFARYAKSKHVFSVFDACFAGTIFNVARSRTPPAITRVTTEPVRQFLSSGDAGQEVSDNGEFASMFIDALEGRSRADANADGYLTATEIGENLTYRMTNVTNNRQTPRSGKLRSAKFDRGDFVFSLGGAVSAPSVSSVDRDALFWTSIKDSTDAADYQAYLDQYPDGGFAALARIRLKRLSAKVASVVTVPDVKTPAAVKPVVGVYPDDPKPGTVFRDCIDCPEMVVIPSGQFYLDPEGAVGKVVNDTERIEAVSQGPKITFQKTFAVGKFLVKAEEWAQCVKSHACLGLRASSWDQAKKYTNWLSNRTGQRYRLLSETEWDYVAHEGRTTGYKYGRSWREAMQKYGYKLWRKRSKSPTVQANTLGLYELGDKEEWTEDCWNEDYHNSPKNGVARLSGDCPMRVTRRLVNWIGLLDLPMTARDSAYHDVGAPSRMFRVARDILH
jgi:formylglycine-generating enzyme required for sulfatase activity